VHVGYGIGIDDADSHQRALDRLGNLSEKYANFVFRRLQNSHAKVLIFDGALVITSFNWLSFVGDPQRTFRDERGLLVRKPEVVVEAARELITRIQPSVS
jgi:hypothetical protein